ncbi:MAG: hypothetical protein B6D44_06160 [Ignavibacteriales bacterium UTCHB2]|jgi:hypothetical protein|nr:MAG: hypothetical protein B6D44_06160 [Ignavibacteriales bacterium UTCHB2]
MKNNYFLFLLSVVLGLSGNSQIICQTVYENYWVPNNTVFATVRSGNTIYIGGSFNQIGPSTGCGSAIDINTGDPDLTYAKVNGDVAIAIPDGSGGWYIGGQFTKVGGVERNRIARLNADGTLNDNWNPNANNQVFAIIISGSVVYIGGQFTTVGGQARYSLAAVDAESGQVIADWDPTVNGIVYSLAISGNIIYAGGSFSLVDVNQRNNIVALDITTGEVIVDWYSNANSYITSLKVSGSLMYVGGNFTLIGRQTPQPPRNHIAALQISDGEATYWNPNITGAYVQSIVVNENTVYAGGQFSYAGGYQRNNIVAINATTGSVIGNWNPNASAWVNSLVIVGSKLYVGGVFTSIGSQSPQPVRNKIASIDLETGVASTWDPNVDELGKVYTLAVNGSTIYAGGWFVCVGGIERNCLAAFDATTGIPTNWNPNVSDNSGDTTHYQIGWVRKDFSGIEFPYSDTLRFSDSRESPFILSLAVSGDRIYAGGVFTSIGGQTRYNIAAINTITGEVIQGWNPNTNGWVWTISISDSRVYAGGDFTAIGGYARNYIAAIDEVTGQVIDDWNPNADCSVQTITATTSTIYVGGCFSHIGGQDRNCIAALDTRYGQAVSGWDPNITGYIPTVYSIALSGSLIYIGGDFSYVGDQERYCIAALRLEDGAVTDWDPRASGGSPAPEVRSLSVHGSIVYAGGRFTNIGREDRRGIAALDIESGRATSWDPDPLSFPSGSPHDVYAINVFGSELYMGGFYYEVKNDTRSFFTCVTADGVTVVTNSLINGWQTLSVPVVVDDFAKTSVWPTSNTDAYSFCGSGYQPQTTLENGVGYWIGFPSEQDIFYAGEFLEQFQTPVCEGWNIVGSISEEVPISTNVCLFPGPNYFTSSFFIYRNGYQLVTTIKPGMGHWIKVAMDGGLLVNIDPIQCDSPESIEEESMDHFRVIDADGKKQDLYVANLELNPSLGEMDLSMPPPLPEIGFDARFSGDEYIKPVSPDSGEVNLVIDVDAQAYPISLSWELNPENGITYSFLGDSGLGKISDIKSGFGKASFYQIRNNKIHLFASAEKTNNSVNHPTVYSLLQNYPNPFNPITTIKYSLPKVSDIKIIIYDILGREVATLVNEQQQPGNYEVKWDASNISSGIYFYQLKTEKYVDTKKMILLK